MLRLVPVLAALVALTLATPVHATLNACAAAKKQCVAKKTAALLKCHAKNEKPPTGLDPTKFAACLQKAKDKFDGGANPAKGCFAKLEAKFGAGCVTTGDVAALEGTVDVYVDDVVCQLDPAGGTCPPTPTPTPTPMPTSTPLPTCFDAMQNGGETGIDCGGGVCPPCPLGQGCLSNTDCGPTTICSGGMCVCAAGKSDCNVSPIDGCEVSTATDPNNCSSCGLVCNLPNAISGCSASQCTIASCIAPFKNCDGMTANGCEINSGTDHNNCGLCGLTCSFVQSCIAGVCM